MPAVQPRAPRRGKTTAEVLRSKRLRNVGEVIRLYEQVSRALGETADADLERLAAASRTGERAFGDWARRIESLRIFKRRFENGTLSRSRLFMTDPPVPWSSVWTVKEPKAIPFVWEAVAFILGFGVSLLLT